MKKEKKMVLKTIDEFNMMKKLTSKKVFFERYELSMSLITKIAAVDAMSYAANTDRELSGDNKAKIKAMLEGNKL